MIGFEHGWALILAVPWTLLVLRVLGRQKEALEWLRERVSASALARLTVYTRIRPRWHFLWLWSMGALLIGAAAGPYTESLGPVKREARDIVLLIDASLSMTAPDTQPNPVTGVKYTNRLEAARAFSIELVDALPDARFALVSFSGAAAIHSPITVDRHAVKMQLQSVRSHRVTQSTGSEFGQALGTVVHLWRHREQPLQVVLLSDGDVSVDPEPFDAQIEALANLSIPVHTVAFGADESMGMDVFDSEEVVAGVEKPRVVASFRTSRDQSTLSGIADGTGGEALVAERHWVLDLLPALESVPAKAVSLRHPIRRDWSWLLVVLFGGLFLFESRVFRKKLPVVVAVLLALPWMGCSSSELSAHQLNEKGREHFAQESWDEASAAFEVSSAFQVRPWVPTHNLAMVHERRGMYAEAHRLMEQAIVMDPGYLEGFFGDGAVLYAWGHAEFHLEDCRAERTRELWTRARERFVQAEERSGFWGSLKERAATNKRFLDVRLLTLDEVEEECRTQQEAPSPDGGASDGGVSDAGSDGGADGGGADAGGDGGADGGGSDAGPDGGADGGDDGDPDRGKPEGTDGGSPSSGSGEGQQPCGGMTEKELRRVEAELKRVREKGNKTADSWKQVRESQFRLQKGADGGAGEGKPPIRW